MGQPVQDKLNEFFASYDLRTYAKGAILTFADQDPRGVSLLISGVVEQYAITPEGNKLTVNVFKPSAFFPMSWAINRTPNAYFYAAASDVELRMADTERTVAFLRANPDVMFDLLSRVYKGTDALLGRLVLTARGIATSRLLFELLIEAYRFGVEVEGAKRSVTIKQSVLAERSGLARETVSRELHKLAQDGLIARQNHVITLDTIKLGQRLDVNI